MGQSGREKKKRHLRRIPAEGSSPDWKLPFCGETLLISGAKRGLMILRRGLCLIQEFLEAP